MALALSLSMVVLIFASAITCNEARLHKKNSEIISIEVNFLIALMYSFNHPALQHHKVHLIPQTSSWFGTKRDKNKTEDTVTRIQFDPAKLWKLGKGSCPQGTVPIERFNTTLRRFDYHGVDFAGVHSQPGRTFMGAAADISIRNPKTPGDEYTSSAIFVENNGPDGFNQVEAGWTGCTKITPLDSSQSGHHGRRVCYNTDCPGFIQTNRNVYLGAKFDQISVDYGQQYDVGISIHLERGLGWWVALDSIPNSPLGYWPIELFSSMKDGTNTVRFGGEVYTSQDKNISPQMGAGHYREGQFTSTCWMRNVSTVDSRGQVISGDNSYLESADSRCFYAGDNSVKNTLGVFGYYFIFGGVGGVDCL